MKPPESNHAHHGTVETHAQTLLTFSLAKLFFFLMCRGVNVKSFDKKKTKQKEWIIARRRVTFVTPVRSASTCRQPTPVTVRPATPATANIVPVRTASDWIVCATQWRSALHDRHIFRLHSLS